MNQEITIAGTLIDKGDNDKAYYFFFDADTVANRGIVYQLPSNISDIDTYIAEKFGKQPLYKIVMLSDFFVRLVDEVGGITVNGKDINGQQAAQMIREGQYMPVVQGAFAKTKGMNLMFTVPSLLSKLSDTYRTNLSVMDAFKTIMSERKDFDKWKVNYVEIPE